VRCPWCDGVEGGHRALLEHCAEHHQDEVVFTRAEDGRVYYEMHCPLCTQRHRQLIRKGGDSDFLARQEGTIRMVALDMLVTHLMAEHGTDPTDHTDDTALEA
jgi:predicted DCC family thiol-disulfide oxidoreductase YuxK